ncbi:MAG: type IV pilus assembly protein PilM [Lentisphaerae bacterium]|nr:type IV pilus assembly protein PilM [Lentisphaerota bacterium]
MEPRSASRILALDIGASDIKLAEFRFRNAKLELLNLVVRPFGVDPGVEVDQNQMITDALRDILREKRIKPGPVGVSVTAQSSFHRLVKLPPVKRDKVYQTVQYEAIQTVPFPINEVVWDYQLMGESENDMEVMLVACKSDIVEKLTLAVEASGLDLQLVDMAPMAIYNAVRFNYDDIEGCTLVIDIGARSTNLVFMEGNRLYSRTLPVVGAGNAITQQLMKEFKIGFAEAEELKFKNASVAFGGSFEDYADKTLSMVSKAVRSSMTRLHVEIERTITFYTSQQGGTRPARVLLAGGTSVIARTDEFFREKMKVPVEHLNPFRNVVLGRNVASEDIEKCAHAMGEVVGVALRQALPCPIEINLMPRNVAEAKAFRRKRPILALAGAGLILIAGCWYLSFFSLGGKMQQRKEGVQARVEQLEAIEMRLQKVESQAEKAKDEAQVLSELVAKRSEWLRVIDAIYDCMRQVDPGTTDKAGRARMESMWLVSVTPEFGDLVEAAAAPAARQRTARTARPAAPGVAKRITHIEIKGRIFDEDGKSKESWVRNLCDRFRESPLFGESTTIVQAPALKDNEYVREFQIQIALKKPL